MIVTREERQAVWEYRTIKLDSFTGQINTTSLAENMDRLGAEGFECFEIIRGSNCNILLFKRKR